MNETLTKLQTITVGSGGVSSVTFSNIPQNYTDLVVKASVRSTTSGGSQSGLLRINGDTGSVYSYRNLSADGSSAASSSSTSVPYIYIGAWPAVGGTANTFNNCEIYIPNYASNNNKSISIDAVHEANSTTAYSVLEAGLYPSTSAITSLTFLGYADSIAQYSTFTLYGVKALRTAVGNSIKATGGTITFDGTYIYHAFTSTGAFQPTTNLLADVFVVAGGGAGGGSYQGAGGGAGGLLGFSNQTLTSSTSYVCTVGSGGTGNSASYNGGPGSNGSNSQFASLTAAIGGGGGSASGNDNAHPGQAGGSGGGSANGTSGGGAGTSGQGNAGVTGGGGGAGAAGTLNGGTPAAAGGIGATYNTTVGGSAGPYGFIDSMGAATNTGQYYGGHYYYAGGGGAAQFVANGGVGGGGSGTISGSNVGTAGTANTGGGGGGGSNSVSSGTGAGAAGGSGIIIVRYKA